MLQWMGGSRRKVYASRKSTQSRQRQYFEQKKRQQQRPGLQNQVDVEGTSSQAYGDQAPRSLDVMSLNNLATPVSQRNGCENADSAVPQVNCKILNASPIEVLNKTTSVHASNPSETSSPPRLSSPVGHQDVAAAVNPHEDSLGCKISPSKNFGAKKRNQNVELHSGEISLIDLVSYEGSKYKSTERPAREAHVSFSVKGLGHVKMETPPQSPRSTKRVLPLPPKATRYTQNKARRFIPFNATKGLDSVMSGISMMKERRSSDKMCSLVEETGYERRKHSYFPHSFEDYNDNLYHEDEEMFREPQAEFFWQSKHGRLADDLPDVKSERSWKIESFNSDDHFPTPRLEQIDTLDYDFKERYSPEQRTSTRTGTRFETSGNPSGHDFFSDQLLLDDDEDMVHFDWERHPPVKKISSSNSTFGPSGWSLEMVDDSEKRRSPLSEESCSSAAAMKDRASKKSSLSVKCEKNNMSKKDDFHISLDIPKMDAHLDEISLFRDPEEYNKRTKDQKNLDTGYWSDKAMEQQKSREPSCRLSLQEKFADWGSSTSHLKSGNGLNNSSSCTVMHEDKSFNSIPDMSAYQSVASTERRPASKVSYVFQRPDNATFDNGIYLQNTVSDMLADKVEFSNPFCATNLRSDIDMNTFLGQEVDKKKTDNFDTFRSPKTDIFQSARPVRQTVGGQHNTCSKQFGKDSLRQEFNPGTDMQESRLNSFWENGHVNNDTFQGDIELSGLLARKNGDKDKSKIKKFERPETKMSTETSQPSANFRTEMSEAETCSDGSEVTNYPVVQKETSAAATHLPANVSCLQETSREMFQIHARAECVRKETIENPDVDLKAPSHLRNKTHDVGDHSKRNFLFQSPFIGEEVGIEKKVIVGVSPNNSDVQYEVMLEHRVLRRLCVQKILVDTPMKDKLNKNHTCPEDVCLCCSGKKCSQRYCVEVQLYLMHNRCGNACKCYSLQDDGGWISCPCKKRVNS